MKIYLLTALFVIWSTFLLIAGHILGSWSYKTSAILVDRGGTMVKCELNEGLKNCETLIQELWK